MAASPDPFFVRALLLPIEMSLKHFHLLFIVVAAVFSLGFGAWALLSRDLEMSVRGMGAFSVVLSLGLSVYGVWFFRKSRQVIT